MPFFLESDDADEVETWLDALATLRGCAAGVYDAFRLYQQGLKENPSQAR